jgi:hypothetical protein
MSRAQFSLKTMLWLMVVVAAFWSGTRWPTIAPQWGEPSYRELGHGWFEVRWWTGRTEVIGFWAGSVFNRGTPDEYTTGTGILIE